MCFLNSNQLQGGRKFRLYLRYLIINLKPYAYGSLLSTSESLHIPRPTARLIHVLRRLYSSSLPDDGARNAGRPTRPLDRASNADLYRVRCRRASIWTLDFQPRIPGGAASVSVQESDQFTSAALLLPAHFVHFSLCSLRASKD